MWIKLKLFNLSDGFSHFKPISFCLSSLCLSTSLVFVWKIFLPVQMWQLWQRKWWRSAGSSLLPGYRRWSSSSTTCRTGNRPQWWANVSHVTECLPTRFPYRPDHFVHPEDQLWLPENIKACNYCSLQYHSIGEVLQAANMSDASFKWYSCLFCVTRGEEREEDSEAQRADSVWRNWGNRSPKLMTDDSLFLHLHCGAFAVTHKLVILLYTSYII